MIAMIVNNRKPQNDLCRKMNGQRCLAAFNSSESFTRLIQENPPVSFVELSVPLKLSGAIAKRLMAEKAMLLEMPILWLVRRCTKLQHLSLFRLVSQAGNGFVQMKTAVEITDYY
ncbi:Hypothetical_protein [Hexamita inflata]|uniref:Hypothetical_protein n=1 Tax=Hexamita inflata TaxID=28002 RepID=A0AA86RGD1_9EUKA|nr:Hypothetical protein HINF_LOCUS61841 [Hexamita inflata]CAI9974198.1 Hypothetical protein HINF_LOCUS61843 [Hexamita inflata]